MILGRKTASLVQYCLKLIGQGISAKVKGRDIGNQLIKEIDNVWEYAKSNDSYEPNFNAFNAYLQNYNNFKVRQWNELDYRDKLIEILDDKLDAIHAVYISLIEDFSLKGLKDKTKSLFSDSDKYVNLCTVHRAKGLEAERVFILKPDDMPLVWGKQQLWEYQQEQNLLYVALTRSKSELYLLGKASWFREGRSI